MYIGIGIGAVIIVIIVVAVIIFKKKLITMGCVNEGNSGNRSEGRLEVITRRSSDTMCDDDFDINDVGVICRIAQPTALKGRAFGEGTENIRRDAVGCALESRPYGPGVNNCQYNEDVDITYQTVTTVGFVNKGNSGNRPEGHLEVITRPSRGTVCDDDFVANDAHVIYRIAQPTVLKGRAFGEGTENIRRDEVGCFSFPDAMESRHNGPGVNNCQYNEDVDITYQTVTRVGLENEGNSGNTSEAGLNLYASGSKYTKCDGDFGSNDSYVFRQIAQPTVIQGGAFGESIGYKTLDEEGCLNLSCAQESLYNWQELSKCQYNEDDGITYQSETTVGLVNEGTSENTSEAGVNEYTSGSRDTDCDDGFFSNDTDVFRQIAQPTVNTWGSLGESTGNERLDRVGCLSLSGALESRHDWPGVNNCQYNEDVGITYQTVTPVGLENEGNSGNTSEAGLDVYASGSKYTECDDDFGSNDSYVFRQIAQPTVIQGGAFGESIGYKTLDEEGCLNLSCAQESLYNWQELSKCQYNEDDGITYQSDISETMDAANANANSDTGPTSPN